MDYKATIILACYNKEKFLERCLKSIITLSRFNDFEVIFVDDCSTDKSVEIINKYAKKYSNIKLFVHEKGSGGPSKPRNTGIKNSHGKYILFMDPDDQIINDGYSVLLSEMEEYDSDILIGTREGVNELNELMWIDYFETNPYININNERLQKDLLIKRPFILKTIYSREMIINNNICFNEKLFTSEDEAFDMECVYYANKITKINDIVYRYTVESEGSITTNVSLKIYKQLPYVFDELTRVYQKMFSDILIANRLIGLIDTFYLPKLSYIENNDDIIIACEEIYKTFEKYGFEKLSKVSTLPYYNLVRKIKEKRYNDLIFTSFSRRIKKMSKLTDKIHKKNKKLRKKIRNYKNASSFKVKLRTFIGDLLRKKSKEKLSILDEKQIKMRMKLTKSNNEPNNYWVFSDREDKACDNAETLYRYVKNNHIYDKIIFVINKTSSDYLRLKEDGFNVCEFGSHEHWEILKNAKYYFTSHCDMKMIFPWDENIDSKLKEQQIIKPLYKLIFLQHGVIRCDMSGWLGNKNYYQFICTSPYEYNSLLDIPDYRLIKEQILLSGLPRFDLLKENVSKKKSILIFPTWRKELLLNIEDNTFKDSDFYKYWTKLLCSSEFINLIDKFNIEVNMLLHHDISMFKNDFIDILPENIKLKRYEEVAFFNEIVNDNSMLITDYSSFSFDFLYVNKPVVYYDFSNAALNNLVDIQYSNFGLVSEDVLEVVNYLENIIVNNFIVNEKYLQNIKKLFAYQDQNNSKRVIEKILHLENDLN